MKRIILFVLFFGMGMGFLPAQEVEFSNVRAARFMDCQAMKNGEEIEGYFTFYMVDKSKKSKSYDKKHFELVLFDSELQEVKRVDVLRQKTSVLSKAVYNGDHFVFLFAQADGGRVNYETVYFNKHGEEVGGKKYDAKTKGLFMTNPAAGVAANGLCAIPNVGFAMLKWDRSLGYQTTIACVDNTGETVWETKKQKKKAYSSHDLLFANEQIIVSIHGTRSKMLSTAVAAFVQILDAKTGEVIAEKKLANNLNFLSPLGAHYDPWTEEVILYGEYFGVKKNGGPNIKDKKGVFFRKMKMDGTVTGEKFASFEKSITPKMAKNASVKKGEKRSIMIHDVISKKDGGFYVIGEQYNKVVSGSGVAMKAVFGQSSNVSVMKIAIYDMVVMDFDAEMKLKNIDVVAKQKVNGALAEGMGLVSEDKLAYLLKLYGVFDYEYTQLDNNMENWTVTYLNYDRKAEGIGNQKLVIGTVTAADDGEMKVNKYNIKDKPSNMWISPARDGRTALLTYYKKTKEAKLKFVK